MLVDVGLIGFLLVGKLILFLVVIGVKLKIVVYEFIILVLNFGMVMLLDGCDFVMVDMLGLINGVFKGVGLGFQFLCYIEWIWVFLYLVDLGNQDVELVFEKFYDINKELVFYDLEFFKWL